MGSKKQSHEQLPTMNRFSWKCFKPAFDPSFKHENKKPTHFIFIIGFKELVFMNKTTKMIEHR